MAQAQLNVTMQGQGLQDGLSKWQKSLGLVRDATGRLFNSQQQWVDGLNRSQITMGLYRDGLDNIRNQQGQLVVGLQAWEIELGRYTDQLGNVMSKEGERIRIGQGQIAVNTQLMQSLKGIGVPLLHLAQTTALLGDENSKALSKTLALTGSLMSMVGPVSQGVKALRSMMIATQGQSAAQVILNAVTGNWITLAAGLTAAAGAYYFLQMENDVAKANEKIKQQNEFLKEQQKIRETLTMQAQKIIEGGKTEYEKTVSDVQQEFKQLIQAYNESLITIDQLNKARAALNKKLQVAYESSVAGQQNKEESRRLDNLLSDASFEYLNLLTSEEKQLASLREQQKRYEDELRLNTKLTEYERKVLQDGIDAKKKQLESITKEITLEDELQAAIKKRKEKELRQVQLLAIANDTTRSQALRNEAAAMLGLPQQEQKQSATSMFAGNVSAGSSEAYKIIVGAKDKTADAIDRANQKTLAAIDRVGDRLVDTVNETIGNIGTTP